MTQQQYSPMQTVKRRFFAMRNGVVADTLRSAGSPYKVIFGLNLPQIVDIARDMAPDRTLAEELWANKTTRESQLAAPMIMPRESFTVDDARRWCASIADRESADILCHRLLRHLPYAADLAAELVDTHCGTECYAGIRLAMNILYGQPAAAKAIARKVLDSAADCPADALAVARALLDEAEVCGI